METTLAHPAATRSSRVALAALAQAMAGGTVVALTGAGMSTDSGIPDYRSPGAPVRRPMTHGEFLSGPVARQRYWARSHLGYRTMAGAVPNAGHDALARLEAGGIVDAVITQNVDGLHQAAGSRGVVDLHGRIDEVVCVDCSRISPRADLAERMTELNPGFGAGLDLSVNPDGDVELADTTGFRVPDCSRCLGVLKPRVVFFGDSVPRSLVAECFDTVAAARLLLVVGSSLTVMSGLRFVRFAAKHDIEVAIVNRGSTRGDPLAALRLDSGCSETLTALADALT